MCCLIDNNILQYIKSHPNWGFYINANSYNLQGYANDQNLVSYYENGKESTAGIPIRNFFSDRLNMLTKMSNCYLVNPSGNVDHEDTQRLLVEVIDALGDRLPEYLKSTYDITFSRRKIKEAAPTIRTELSEHQGFVQEIEEFLVHADQELERIKGERLSIADATLKWNEWLDKKDAYKKLEKSKQQKRNVGKMRSAITVGPQTSNDLLGLLYCEQFMRQMTDERPTVTIRENKVDYKAGSLDPVYVSRRLKTVSVNRNSKITIDKAIMDLEGDDAIMTAYLDEYGPEGREVIIQHGRTKPDVKVLESTIIQKSTIDLMESTFRLDHPVDGAMAKAVVKRHGAKLETMRNPIEFHEPPNHDKVIEQIEYLKAAAEQGLYSA